MDVVVVGGGIVGLAAAHALADRGEDVCLFERDGLGTGSTARAAGGIRTQFETEVNVELSLASKRVWDSFTERFGINIGHRKTGYLLLARSDRRARGLRENAAMQRRLGAETKVLSPSEARERCPGLDPEQFVAATYNPDDGIADPNLAVQGYASAAREAGATIETGTAVTDIERRDGAVRGVETEDGSRAAEYVVNAAGPAARRVAAMADIDVPIAPRRRQIAVVEPARAVLEDDPLTIDLETGSYFRPDRGGDALVGGHFADADPDADPRRFDESTDLEWAATAVERASEYAAYFGPETRIKRGWAGLYAVTPDNHPIVEESIPGLITVSGFSGHGFQHAPAAGRVAADLVRSGEPHHVDTSALTRDRFETDDALLERNVV